MNKWSTMYFGPIKEVIGFGAIDAIGEMAAEKKLTKVLLVTDDGVMAAGHPQRAAQSLENRGIETVIFDEVRTDPLDTMVRDGLALLNREECDGVVAVGGGSSMDVAKAIAAMKTNPGDIMDYTRHTQTRRAWTARRIPLFLIVSTAGTGSEQSPYAIITNTAIHRKCNVSNPDFHPDGIILDAEVTATLDRKWTVSCGFDTLAHLCDGISVKAEVEAPNAFHEAIVYPAIGMCYRSIARCAAIPENLKAREDLLVASDLAGMVLSAGTGATHGLGNILSKYYHIPHGETVGMLLPYVMEYNLPACPDRFARMAEAMGADITGLSEMEAARRSVELVKELIEVSGLPHLGDYMKEEELTEEFLTESLDNTCNFTNAREVTLEAAKSIFTKALRAE